MRVSLLIALALLATSAFAANWAVLVAGSNGFYNYRHQADVFHAQKSLLAKGFSAERIITLAYDDIANAPQNPFKGKVFNKPTPKGVEGVDVYKGVTIDYKGKDVTPEVFLAVLRGDAAAVKGKGNGRVLASTAEDRVFIFFSDHGATSLIAFPSTYLYAKDLQATFKYMFDNKKYAKLVFYLEACESGSMFQNVLPANMNIYALSAANPTESSWGYYCSPDDKVNGVSVGSCLGDLFSINFVESLDTADTKATTLDSHFQTIKRLTTKSEVMQWGDVSFTQEPIGNYMGNLETARSKFARKVRKIALRRTHENSAVDSRLIKLHYLTNTFKNNATTENFEALQSEFTHMRTMKSRFSALKQQMQLSGLYHRSENQDCLKNTVEAFEQSCGKLNDWSLQFVSYLAEYCDRANDISGQQIKSFLSTCNSA